MTRTKRDLHISFGNFIKSQFFSNNEVWAELAGLRRFYNSGNMQLSQAQNQNIGYNRTIRARSTKEPMTNTKFVVKLNRGGVRGPQYVQRIDRAAIQTTSNRKLALTMGRFTAEDVIKSMQNSRCNPELVSVAVRS